MKTKFMLIILASLLLVGLVSATGCVPQTYDSECQDIKDYKISNSGASGLLTDGSWYIWQGTGVVVIETPSLPFEGEYEVTIKYEIGNPEDIGTEDFEVECGGETFVFLDDDNDGTESWIFKTFSCEFDAGVNEIEFRSTNSGSVHLKKFQIIGELTCPPEPPECVNDYDCDTIIDWEDNCKFVWNPLQEDCNDNDKGDVCDATPCDYCEHDAGIRYSYGNSFGTGIAISEEGVWLSDIVAELTEGEDHSIKYYIDNKISETTVNVHVIIKVDAEIIDEYDYEIGDFHYKTIDLDSSELDCDSSHIVSIEVEIIDETDCNSGDNYASREIIIECEHDDDRKGKEPFEWNFCESSWKCSGWSDCWNGIMTRNCVDENHCEIEYNQPLERTGCTSLSKVYVEETSNYIWILVGVIIFIILLIILINLLR